MIKALAVTGAVAAAIAPAAPGRMLDPGPPEDPGVAGIPHCTVPALRGVRLAVAKKRVTSARCTVQEVVRKRSTVAKGRVASVVPRAGTVLAEGTGLLLVVSSGRAAGRTRR